MDDEATCETSPSSRGRRLTGLNVAEDVPLRTTPVMLRGGRSREPLSRQGLTWDEFLDELEQIERLGPHSAPGSAPGSPAASPAPGGPRLPLTHTHSLPDAASGCWSGSAASSTSSSPSRRVPSNTHLDLMVEVRSSIS